MKITWVNAVKRQFKLLDLILGVTCGVCLGGGVFAYYFATKMQLLTEFAKYADSLKNLESAAGQLILLTVSVITIFVIVEIRRAMKVAAS